MPRIPDVAIVQHLWNAGFRGSELGRATSVAIAESGGDTAVVSSTGCCYGLMQINVRKHTQWTAEQMRDPVQNTKAAYTLWKESGWRPWDSSRLGQFAWRLRADAAVQKFLASNPKEILPNVGGQVADTLVPGRGSESAITSLGNAVQFFTVGRNWGRIGMIGLGGILLIVALAQLSKPITVPIIKTAAKGAKLAA